MHIINKNKRFTDIDPDKLRGGYYTSQEVADWLASWAIQNKNHAVLEPSCGDGAFVAAACKRLVELGAAKKTIARQVVGVEIIRQEALIAREKLFSAPNTSKAHPIEIGDFFEWWKTCRNMKFDAVIGNPPFIRYQTFPEPYRTRAMNIMVELGLTPNKLTNIWVPFVAAASARLKEGGRLAMVLPAELLQVKYASQLRSFLTDRFSKISIVACNELFFQKAEQEVVLLLADRLLKTPSVENDCKVALVETKKVVEITNSSPDIVLQGASPKHVSHASEKWLKYFLTASEIELMRNIRESKSATTLETHATVNVGVVTGKNQFFVLDSAQVKDIGLIDYVMPLVSRSVQIKGARFTVNDWESLSAGPHRVHLLDLRSLNGSKPKGPLKKYIQFGEKNEVHKGYKCSIRTPWYVVPSIWIPDGFVMRQIYDFPRMVLNETKATATDTIHRLKCKKDPELFISNTYTYLTAASAEIEGRSYGGGVLELEPKEAQRLLVPAKLVKALPLNECDRLIKDGRLMDVLKANETLVLKEGMGLSSKECSMLKNIWEKMRDRRLSRSRRKKSNK